jgi:hypothetical protein
LVVVVDEPFGYRLMGGSPLSGPDHELPNLFFGPSDAAVEPALFRRRVGEPSLAGACEAFRP